MEKWANWKKHKSINGKGCIPQILPVSDVGGFYEDD